MFGIDDYLMGALVAQGVGTLGGALAGRFGGGRLPKYQPMEYASELPSELSSLLEQQSLGQMDALQRFGQVSGQQRVGALAARGIYDAPTAASARGASQAVTAPLLSNTLSERARNTLTLLNNLNRFKQLEHQMQYQGQVGRAQQTGAFYENIFGGLGDTVGTGLFTKYLGDQDADLMARIRRLIASPTGTLGMDPGMEGSY